MRHRTGRVALVMLGAIGALAATAGTSAAIEGLRGATWGQVRWEAPEDRDSNVLLDGWARQGIDWRKWGQTRLSTFAILRLRADTEGFDWNNSVGPGVGIGLDTSLRDQLQTSLTVEYVWEHYGETDRTEEKLLVYANWFGWWDLGGK